MEENKMYYWRQCWNIVSASFIVCSSKVVLFHPLFCFPCFSFPSSIVI